MRESAARPITVLKLGSSVLAREEDLPRAVREIARVLDAGDAVVAVVSALGGTTDDLLRGASRLARRPEPASMAALLATGERAAAALLAIALHDAGVPAELVEPERVGLRAEGPSLDGAPCGLDAEALHALLRRRSAAVVPGFFARSAAGEVATFGRGGSDLTALYLAERLGARACRLVKDVDGVYDGDPSGARVAPARFETLSYSDALALGARVVQEKAIRFAAARGISFTVGAAGGGGGTTICAGPTKLERITLTNSAASLHLVR